MNIEEEADPIKSVEAVSDRMILLHVTDSNRRAPGRGHAPFPGLIEAVRRIGYQGPWIVECVPPDANPLVADPKNSDRVVEEATGSILHLRALEEA